MCISYHVSIRTSCDALHSEAMKPHNWELTHCTWRPAGNTSLSPHQALFYLGIGPFRVQVWIVLILLWNGNIRVTSKGSTHRHNLWPYQQEFIVLQCSAMFPKCFWRTWVGCLTFLAKPCVGYLKTPSAELPKIWSCSFFCSSCFL